MTHKEVIQFLQGMGSDIDQSKQTPSSYIYALNKVIDEDNGVFSLSNMKGSVELPTVISDAGYVARAAFPVSATYNFNKVERESLVIFTLNETTGEGKIFIYDTENLRLHLIFDDLQAPGNDRRENLDFGKDIDAIHHKDGDDLFLYWCDGKNHIRYMKLHVGSDLAFNNSPTNTSPLYIGNESDLLYVQRLFPVDDIRISQVFQKGGVLDCASYQFAYRYYNTESRTFSTWSIICNPVPIIIDDVTTTKTNDLQGYLPGAQTPKSIQLRIDKNHRHHKYYDSIQIAVIKSITEVESDSVMLLRPSKEYYGTVDTVSFILYTGREEVVEDQVLSITTDDSSILHCKTLEEHNGRMFLGGISYWDLEVQDPNPVNWDAEVHTTGIGIPGDVMISLTAENRGYYDELHNQQLKGHFRGELYRYGRVYIGKFGQKSAVNVLDFSGIDKYDGTSPATHALTWLKNWATEGTDWKYPDRQSQEGCIFVNSSNQIKAMGLRLTGLDNHPSWAFAMMIVRAEREKDILGQTPVINGVAIQGGAFQSGYWDLDLANDFWTNTFYDQPDSYDYDGLEDYIGPRIMAHGAAKNLTYSLLKTGVVERSRLHYLGWELLGDKRYGAYNDLATHETGFQLKRRNNNCLFTYPLEFLANSNGQEYSGIVLDGSEKIQVVDLFALTAFNAYRDDWLGDTNDVNNIQFLNGYQNKYVWVYGQKDIQSSYYHNSAVPGSLLEIGKQVSVAEFPVNVAPYDPLKIVEGYKFDWGAPAEILSRAISNDDACEHIRKLVNGDGLVNNQTANDETLWRDVNLPAPNAIVNQRGICLILSGDEKADDTGVLNFIYDPNRLIHDSYSGAPANIDDIFPGHTLSPNGLYESKKALDTTDPEWALVESDMVNNQVIDPSTDVFVYMANIIKGLGDLRYGSKMASKPFIFTGAYHSFTKSEIDNNTPIDFDVYGGDCLITRNIIKLRENAPKKGLAEVEDPAKHYIALTAGFRMDAAHKVSTYKQFVEILDVWVESTVNGHYLFKPNDTYPAGIENRDVGSEVVATKEYEYPPDAGFTPYVFASRYFYNFGYSIENKQAQFNSDDENQFEFLKAVSRVQYGPLVTYNSGERFGRFLVNDVHELDPSNGAISKILEMSRNRLLVIQEDGVAVLNLGQTMTEGNDGFTINLSSGKVIGYSQYMSQNNETSGDMGSSHLRAIKKTEQGAIFYDSKRKKIVSAVSGLKDMSFGRIRQYLEDNLPDGDIVAWYDNVRKKWGVYNNDTGKGVMWHDGLRVWETFLEFDPNIKIADIVVSNGKTFALVNDGVPKLFQLDANDDRSLIFGYDNKSEVHVVLNRGQGHSGEGKIIVNVIAESTENPDQAVIDVDGASPLVSGSTSFRKTRHKNYIANEFRDSVSQSRIYGQSFIIKILTGAKVVAVKIRSLFVNYRTKSRENE